MDLPELGDQKTLAEIPSDGANPVPNQSPEERLKEYHRNYYMANREAIIADSIARKKANPERVRELANVRNAKNRDEVNARARANYEKNKAAHKITRSRYAKANPQKIKAWKKSSKKKNKDKNNARTRERRKENVQFKISACLRQRVHSAMNSQSTIKIESGIRLIGCSFDFFRKRMESMFDENMTWENHGVYWEIDHIVPVSYFDLRMEHEHRRAFHYLNCQPLEAEENNRKNDTLPENYLEILSSIDSCLLSVIEYK